MSEENNSITAAQAFWFAEHDCPRLLNKINARIAAKVINPLPQHIPENAEAILKEHYSALPITGRDQFKESYLKLQFEMEKKFVKQRLSPSEIAVKEGIAKKGFLTLVHILKCHKI